MTEPASYYDGLYDLLRMMRENRGERCAALLVVETAIDAILDDNPARFTNEHRRLIDRLQRLRALVAVDDLEDHVEQMAMDLPGELKRAGVASGNDDRPQPGNEAGAHAGEGSRT